MTFEEAQKRIDAAVMELGEHFDSVQVLTTWQQESQTNRVFGGAGNWYARQGMAHEFIQNDIAQDAAHQLSKVINPPPEE